MNFKTCQIMNDHFLLDNKFVPFFKGSDGKNIYVTDGLEKGYIYASLFFYDEVQKEIQKLEKTIRNTKDEVLMDVPDAELSVMMVEISRRVKDVIGDDSLDALIKQILAEQTKHISLVPDEKEIEKFETIKESIFTEILANFYDITIQKSEEQGESRTITLAEKYVSSLTERQKKLFSPALRMVGFINNIRLEDYNATADFNISFRPERLNKPFDAQEEIIKTGLKELMSKNS